MPFSQSCEHLEETSHVLDMCAWIIPDSINTDDLWRNRHREMRKETHFYFITDIALYIIMQCAIFIAASGKHYEVIQMCFSVI